MNRAIEDLVDDLRHATRRGSEVGCTLLIGAGCPVSAGVPTATGFVQQIEKRYPAAYQRATKKTYAQCMAATGPGQRRDLIADYVNQAQLNWAHLCIAQLIKHGYIHRVLTTNFDPLIVRACALLGVFPAIYDFAVSQHFKPAFIPTPAIFYLHGQHTGFVLMNTEEEVRKHSALLAPVFEDAGQGRVWLTVGYSGENDPVFQHLVKVSEFEYNLYWVGYENNELAKHVREELLIDGKSAFFVKGFDADRLLFRSNQIALTRSISGGMLWPLRPSGSKERKLIGCSPWRVRNTKPLSSSIQTG